MSRKNEEMISSALRIESPFNSQDVIARQLAGAVFGHVDEYVRYEGRCFSQRVIEIVHRAAELLDRRTRRRTDLRGDDHFFGSDVDGVQRKDFFDRIVDIDDGANL